MKDKQQKVKIWGTPTNLPAGRDHNSRSFQAEPLRYAEPDALSWSSNDSHLPEKSLTHLLHLFVPISDNQELLLRYNLFMGLPLQLATKTVLIEADHFCWEENEVPRLSKQRGDVKEESINLARLAGCFGQRETMKKYRAFRFASIGPFHWHLLLSS